MAAIQFDDVRGHAVQEGAVVGDGDDTALERQKQIFKPRDRVQIQVVGGLVEEQHIGPGDKRLGQCDPFARPSGKRADNRLGLKVQAV